MTGKSNPGFFLLDDDLPFPFHLSQTMDPITTYNGETAGQETPELAYLAALTWPLRGNLASDWSPFAQPDDASSWPPYTSGIEMPLNDILPQNPNDSVPAKRRSATFEAESVEAAVVVTQQLPSVITSSSATPNDVARHSTIYPHSRLIASAAKSLFGKRLDQLTTGERDACERHVHVRKARKTQAVVAHRAEDEEDEKRIQFLEHRLATLEREKSKLGSHLKELRLWTAREAR